MLGMDLDFADFYRSGLARNLKHSDRTTLHQNNLDASLAPTLLTVTLMPILFEATKGFDHELKVDGSSKFIEPVTVSFGSCSQLVFHGSCDIRFLDAFSDVTFRPLNITLHLIAQLHHPTAIAVDLRKVEFCGPVHLVEE